MNAYGEVSEDEESDEEGDNVCDLLSIEELQKKKEKMKVSVSAEVYGQFNKKTEYVPKYIEKTPE